MRVSPCLPHLVFKLPLHMRHLDRVCRVQVHRQRFVTNGGETGGIPAVFVAEALAAFENCAFTDNLRGFSLEEGATARLEGCTFLRNKDDVLINQNDDSVMYTDIPERSLMRGEFYTGSVYNGDILGLNFAPDDITLKLNSTNAEFVALRQVRYFVCAFALRRCSHACCEFVTRKSCSTWSII